MICIILGVNNGALRGLEYGFAKENFYESGKIWNI